MGGVAGSGPGRSGGEPASVQQGERGGVVWRERGRAGQGRLAGFACAQGGRRGGDIHGAGDTGAHSKGAPNGGSGHSVECIYTPLTQSGQLGYGVRALPDPAQTHGNIA